MDRRTLHKPLLFLCAAAAIAAGTTWFATAMVFTPGGFQVSETGAAVYEIPIKVPPGIAGMEPKLSLVYNSQQGNGLLGVGWSLSGLSAITRCPRTMAQDGVRGGINYDSNDRFCLDGQRLISISGTYGAEQTEYRTERESFTKVVSYGQVASPGNGPQWFKVWTKSGQILEYGNTTDSRIEAQGKQTVRVWAMNRISDTKGNYLAVAYTEDSANGSFVPERIEAGNAAASPTPRMSVLFTYEERTDIQTAYRGGSVIKTTHRLKLISTYAGEAGVKKYALNYEYGAATGRSRLAGVSECDFAGTTCLPATSFGWKPETAGFAIDSGLTPPSYIQDYAYSPSRTYGQLIDVNGDGLLDWVRAYRSHDLTVVRTIWLNTGNGWEQNPGYTPPSYIYDYAYSPSRTYGQLIDVNGDGLPDWVQAYRSHTGTVAQTIWLNTGNGWEQNAAYTPPSYIYDYAYEPSRTYGQLIDVNGDGLPDWVQAYRSHSGTVAQTIWLNTGNGWQSSAAYTPPAYIYDYAYSPSRTYGQLIDVNGDGLPDWVRAYRFHDGTAVQTIWLNTGNGWQQSAAYTPPSYIEDYAYSPARTYGQLIDVNGDGLPDWVRAYRFHDATVVQTTWLNTGNGWQQSAAYAPPMYIYDYAYSPSRTYGQSIDVNGDGLPDWVRAYRFHDLTPVQTIWRANSAAPDLMLSVTDGLGAQTQFAYRPLTDPTIYTRDGAGGSGGYPTRNLQIPFFVVKSTSTSNGIGSTISTDHVYGGLKVELGSGRGLLGFRWKEASDANTGLKVRTEFRQDWPYVGLPSQVKRMKVGGSVLSQVDTMYACLNPATGAACTMAVGNRYFPYASRGEALGKDLDGSFVAKTCTTSQFDTYGNATEVVITHLLETGTCSPTIAGATGYSKTTTNIYFENDDSSYVEKWLLGRLKRSTVTSTTP